MTHTNRCCTKNEQLYSCDAHGQIFGENKLNSFPGMHIDRCCEKMSSSPQLMHIDRIFVKIIWPAFSVMHLDVFKKLQQLPVCLSDNHGVCIKHPSCTANWKTIFTILFSQQAGARVMKAVTTYLLYDSGKLSMAKTWKQNDVSKQHTNCFAHKTLILSTHTHTHIPQ